MYQNNYYYKAHTCYFLQCWKAMVTYMFAATVKNKPHPPTIYVRTVPHPTMAARLSTMHSAIATHYPAAWCAVNVAFSCAPTDGNLHSYNVRRDRMSRKCYSTMLVGGQKLLATCPFSENLDITLQLKASLFFLHSCCEHVLNHSFSALKEVSNRCVLYITITIIFFYTYTTQGVHARIMKVNQYSSNNSKHYD